jgi:hypothetical protein
MQSSHNFSPSFVGQSVVHTMTPVVRMGKFKDFILMHLGKDEHGKTP